MDNIRVRTESLDTTVNAVHELLESQASRNPKDNIGGHHDSCSSVRKRQPSSNSVQVDDGDVGSTPQQCTIEVSKVVAHNNFVERLGNELVKANTFYATKLLELKFEFLQLLFVQLELGLVRSKEENFNVNLLFIGIECLFIRCCSAANEMRTLREQVERHALLRHDRFDPGSTMSIIAQKRSFAGINVRFNEDEDVEKDELGEYGNEPLLGTQQLRNPTQPRLSAIVFEGSATDDSRYSTGRPDPQRAVEDWLMGSQLHCQTDNYTTDDAFQVGSSLAWR